MAAGLDAALTDGKLEDWFASLPPQTDEYRALYAAHEGYFRRAGETRDLPAIANGKAIKPGQSDKRLPAIAAALSAIGYAPPTPPQRRYSGAMVDAVERLQGDLGLEPDGVIGADTVEALNQGAAGRARQLEVAMERLRWLPREQPQTRIDVNTAAAFLDYWRDGRHVDRRKVVVGEPGWETPQLSSLMVNLVAHPLWRVPDSIVADERGQKSQAYLSANGFSYRDSRIVQGAGPKMVAPASPMANVATGTPLGICTIDKSESSPRK